MTIPDPTRPAITAWHVVEAAVAAFEAADAADPADFCPPPGDPNHLPILRELLRADLEFAWAAGRPRRLEEYRARFPALFADRPSLADVAFEEYRQRRAELEPADPAEYAGRYGIDVTGWPPARDPQTERVTPSALGLGDTPTGGAARFPEPGETFAGFRLLRELGRGSFARVYLAEQADLAGRPVVLKVSPELADESQTLARLQHTNIVPIYSAHRVGLFHAVCMPYFGATTLAEVVPALRSPGGLPATGAAFASTVTRRRDPSEPAGPVAAPAVANPAAAPLAKFADWTLAAAATWVGAQLAEGLAHAHERGVLHRDLKPANVLMADDGRPMLLDFNLAGRTDRPADAVGGTPSYMAPEQLDALLSGPAATDTRSDVYGLGLILYELVTGRSKTVTLAGPLATRVAALRAERAVPPPPARRVNPAVPPALSAILARCLAPDPARRYPTARELADDLRCQVESRPLRHTPEPSAVERAAKFARRHPWVKSAAFLGAALAAVVAVAAVVVFTVVGQRNAAVRAAAERDFRAEAAAHQVALAAGDDHARPRAVEQARATLTRYGLPGGDAGAERRVGDTPAVHESAADLYLMLATVHAADRDAGRARAWLAAARQLGAHRPALQRLDDWLAAPDGPPPAGGDDDADALYQAQVGNDPRRVLALLATRPPGALRPVHYVAQAQCYRHLGRHADAAACYTTVLAQVGRPSAALSAARGRAYFELGRFPAALADFDAALAADPDAAGARLDRGLTLLKLNRPADAGRDLDAVATVWPSHTRVFFVRAAAKAAVGDAAGAATDRARGLADAPGDPTSWVARGMAKLTAGDAAGAVNDFAAALRLDPRHRDARQNQAAALADHLNRTAEAVAVLDALLRDYPDDLPARAGRGVYLARLGRRADAHADAAAVLRREPTPLDRYQVAGIYALTSRTHPADATTALRLLAEALQAGVGLEYVATDPELHPLRSAGSFQRLVAAARELARFRQAK